MKNHSGPKQNSKQARHVLCIKIYFLLKISVPHIEPLTYLTWFFFLKINELHADTDVHFLQRNKAFALSVSCKNKCVCVVCVHHNELIDLIDWRRLFGWDWLYSIVTVQHSFVLFVFFCQHLGYSGWISPKVRFPFIIIFKTFIQLFIYP